MYGYADNPAVQPDVQQIQSAAHRAAKLTRELLITVGSEEGKGTAFHVYLPAITLPAPAPRADAPAPVQGSGENILVVDDEPAMLAVTARILRRNGYHALEARICAEALSLMSSRDFRLLLTDSVMPTMSGPALAHRALELKPGLRILHMSGSIAGVLDPDRVASGATPLIRKSFTSHDLLEKVHTCSVHPPGAAKRTSGPRPSHRGRLRRSGNAGPVGPLTTTPAPGAAGQASGACSPGALPAAVPPGARPHHLPPLSVRRAPEIRRAPASRQAGQCSLPAPGSFFGPGWVHPVR